MSTLFRTHAGAAILAATLLAAGDAAAQFQIRNNFAPSLRPIIGPPTVQQQIAARQLSMLRFASQRYPNLLSPVVVQNRATPVISGLPIVNQLNPAVANPLINPALTNPWINPALTNPALNPRITINNPWAPSSQFTNPYASLANPYTPYTNPYTPASYSSPYDPSYSAGSILFGESDVLRSTANVAGVQEQTRILRENANQAALAVEKKKFDLEQQLRAAKPTFTDEQAKVAKARRVRVQSAATESEIGSGSALNILLNGLMQPEIPQAAIDATPVPEDVLSKINVGTPGGGGNLGLLRNDGRFTWPQALSKLVPESEQEQIEVQSQALLQQAIHGKPDPNTLSDLQTALNHLRDDLTARVNEIPTGQYLEAKRFLTAFDAAANALARGEVAPYFEYRKFITGGKTTRELAQYMLSRGLRFTQANDGDLGAYRALYDALAAYSSTLENAGAETSLEGATP